MNAIKLAGVPVSCARIKFERASAKFECKPFCNDLYQARVVLRDRLALYNCAFANKKTSIGLVNPLSLPIKSELSTQSILVIQIE